LAKHRDPTEESSDAGKDRLVLESSGVGGRFWEITPDLLGVLRTDGYFERANPAWESVLGWTEAEVRSMSIFELLHPDDVEPTRGGFEHLKQGNPILRFENRYRRKDGGHNKDAEQFDVVFSDVVMPGMNGIELGQEIRRQLPGLPVVLTSGYSDVLAQNAKHGFELLHKPYSIDELSRALRKAGSWRQRSSPSKGATRTQR
jgi:CheY-like chemotaxis protein